MTKFVTDTPLTLLSEDDVVSKGDSTHECLGVVECDVTEGVPLLSTDEEEKQQPKDMLRQLPEVEKNLHY